MIEVPPLKQDVGLTRPREDPQEDIEELPPLKIRRTYSPEKDLGPLNVKEVGYQPEKKQVEKEVVSKHSSSGMDVASEMKNGEHDGDSKYTNGGVSKHSHSGRDVVSEKKNCEQEGDSKHTDGGDSKHSSSGKDRRHSSVGDSKHSSVGDSKHSSSGRDSKHSSARDSKHSSSSRDSKHSSDRDSKHSSSGRDSKHSSDRDSKHSSDRNSKQSSGRESKHSSRDSKHSSERESKHSSSDKIKVEKEGGSKHSSPEKKREGESKHSSPEKKREGESKHSSSDKSEKKKEGESKHSSSGRDSKHSSGGDSKHSSSSRDSKHSSERDTKHSSDRDSKHSSGRSSKHSSDRSSKHSSDRDSKHSSSGKDSKHSSDRDSKHSSSRDSKHPSGNESKHSSPGKDSKHSSPSKDLASEKNVEKEGDFKQPSFDSGTKLEKKSVENKGVSGHSSVVGEKELVKIKFAKEEVPKQASLSENAKSEKKRVETDDGSKHLSSSGNTVSEKTKGSEVSELPKPRCASSLPEDSGVPKPRCTSSLPGEYKPRCAASLPGQWKNKLDSDSEDDDDGVKKVKNNKKHLERMEVDDDSEEEFQEERPFFHKTPLKAYLPSDQIIGATPDNFPKDIEPMTFYPTYEEFKDLKKYVAYIESCGAVAAGIVKIVAPKEWIPRAAGYNPGDIDINLDHPVQQNISINDVDGAFKTLSDRSIPHFSPEEYMRLATSDKYITPSHNSYEELEKLYWKQNLDDKLPAPIYGADVCDSVTDPDQKVFNIKRLDSLLTDVMEEQIPGVNLPYLYFGMWKATFSWHIEDMDLYAVNYLHYGAPKTWYCVPPQYGYKLEQVAQKLFPDMSKTCFNMMRHKAVMMSPSVLRANGVKVHKMVQEERNIMMVFPHAYHSGFNHGYNIAESTNFAIDRWVEYGKRFRDCTCRGNEEEVSIDMDPFVKEIQPERHEAWLRNRDFALHPEDPWYIRRCLQDGVERLNREDITEYEFEKLKRELKRMRKVPNWFKERFVLDYDDQIFLELPESGMDMTDCIDEGEVRIKASPRIKAAKRKLKEKLNESAKICDIKMKKLKKTTTDIYMMELKAYVEMQEELERAKEEKKKLVLEGKGSNALGGGAARGVGFQGAVLDDLLEKKSRVVCKAKKNHRFKACAKCSGCRKTNCGECMYCEDMPRFGGLGVIKQKCETRVCVNPTITTCEHCVWTI